MIGKRVHAITINCCLEVRTVSSSKRQVFPPAGDSERRRCALEGKRQIVHVAAEDGVCSRGSDSERYSRGKWTGDMIAVLEKWEKRDERKKAVHRNRQ